MENYGLDLHCEMLLEEYRNKLPLYKHLQQVVTDLLQKRIMKTGLEVNSMESRIKAEPSLAGKLQLKGNKYQSLADITDIFGIRIIMFYNEDVDRIASLLPKSVYYDKDHPELNHMRFELQMRTALQHVWSAIQHDIGYKSEIETPLEYHRNLSRLAGMLELADNEFSRIRAAVAEYRRRALSLVRSGKLDEVQIDGDTFSSYLQLGPFDKLNRKIAAITQAELHDANLLIYLPMLRRMGLHTLADIEKFIANNFDDAYQLALIQLGSTDIDILAENVGLQNLCIVSLLKAGNGKPGLTQLFDVINGKRPENEKLADLVLEQASRLSFMHQ